MTTFDIENFEKRKQDHIDLALLAKNQSCSYDLEKLVLIHEALPDLNFSEINIASVSFGGNIPTPFFVSSMTAGHKNAININAVLAEACSEMSWAMGVGSQRRELHESQKSQEWIEILKNNPKLCLFGNLGIAQLITSPIDSIKRLCDNIQAKALFIHCNPLQECIQPEGTTEFAGCYDAIENLCKAIELPIIIKETGCGFSKKTLARLNSLGVTAVDMSGFGGTHWGRIEGGRAQQEIQKQTAESFNQWGISTLRSMLNALEVQPNFELWASGGIRSGLDAAKYLALGARRIGIAKPMLESALISVDKVIDTMRRFEYELKTALFCTGSCNIEALREKDKWQLKI